MYIVVSEWEALPGKKEAFWASGSKMRDLLRHTPGVKFINAFEDESGRLFAVLIYEDREAYDRIVNDPDGPFARGAAEHKIEEHARWIQSWRGQGQD